MKLRVIKKQLRQNYSARREAMATAECVTKSLAICQHVSDFLASKKNLSRVFCFASHRKEPNLETLIDLLPNGVELGLPVVAPIGREMVFRRYHQNSPLVPNRYGILEPSCEDDLCPILAADNTTIVLVPALAIDPFGYRLGYGGGYYDVFLARIPKVLTVGVTYSDFFVADKLPREPFDQRLDYIVTDKGLVASILD